MYLDACTGNSAASSRLGVIHSESVRTLHYYGTTSKKKTTMNTILSIREIQKAKSVIGLILTLIIIHLIENSLTTLVILLALWTCLFRPCSRRDLVMFALASLFFLGQNYAVLKAGAFTFKHDDVLFMPYYEPFLWGFYYINMVRFISETPGAVKLKWSGLSGLALTILVFSLFSKSSNSLLEASLLSTAILLAMFHESFDLFYAGYALALGLVVELFGVSFGLWKYPEPDFLGIPCWFATMWVSVGLLGRRFLIPLSECISDRF